VFELVGSNEFMWLKPGLKVLTFFWNLQLRFVRQFLVMFKNRTLNQDFYHSQVATKRLLVVWREFNGSNDWALRVIAEKFRALVADLNHLFLLKALGSSPISVDTLNTWIQS
jgi:hypothetical protein